VLSDDTDVDLITQQKQDWDELASFDAYWSILTRRDRKGGRWGRDEFLATGVQDVDRALASAARFRLPSHRGRALDYGCGIGRLTRALSANFDLAVGVDISERMINMAMRLNADRTNCTFSVTSGADLSTFEVRSFDFVYSRLVLQHVPDVRTAEFLISEFIRVLRPDGIAVFQMPSKIDWRYRPRFRRRLYAALRRLGVSSQFLIGAARSNPMRMNELPRTRVEQLIDAAGGELLSCDPDTDSEPQFHSFDYFARRSPKS
jgi:SAM-dependent methyltransferase